MKYANIITNFIIKSNHKYANMILRLYNKIHSILNLHLSYHMCNYVLFLVFSWM